MRPSAQSLSVVQPVAPLPSSEASEPEPEPASVPGSAEPSASVVSGFPEPAASRPVSAVPLPRLPEAQAESSEMRSDTRVVRERFRAFMGVLEETEFQILCDFWEGCTLDACC